MQLSVVTTLFQSAPYIDEFYGRVRAEAEKISSDIGFVFVNDGSTDRSLQTALDLRKQDGRILVVDLSRNFGHHKAIMTGLKYAKGDLVFLIDVDLEEPPEILGPFFEALNKENVDAVYGVQAPRHGPWLTRTLANLFYWIFEILSDYRIPPHSLTARLMTRRYVDELVRQICSGSSDIRLRGELRSLLRSRSLREREQRHERTPSCPTLSRCWLRRRSDYGWDDLYSNRLGN
jgi:putative glycosyltransferase